MSQDKPVLSREAIMLRRHQAQMSIDFVDEHSPGPRAIAMLKQDVALCDIALSALDRQGWISVEERLPEDHEVVIVHGGIAYQRKGEWMTLTGERYPGRPIQWQVTHWMPLPPAPQINEPPQVLAPKSSAKDSERNRAEVLQGPASGSPDISVLVAKLIPLKAVYNMAPSDAARINEAIVELRALEAERDRLMLPPDETLSEHPGCVYCMEAGTPVRRGQVCPKCGDRAPTKDYYRAESLQHQLTQRNEWLEWALSELSALLQSDLMRGMKGSPKSHLDRIAQIRKEAFG
jgi:hypothetical protein